MGIQRNEVSRSGSGNSLLKDLREEKKLDEKEKGRKNAKKVTLKTKKETARIFKTK